jgi:uncharacterized protein (TIGR00730 family)
VQYVEAAALMGRTLARRGLRLVYGGAHVGVMGAIADAALASGGEVTGVIPQSLWDREVAHTALTDLRVVDSMHTRKALMASLADAFVALPGGIGTLEELFEVWTWHHLGLHNKPCGLLDVEGYFRPLVEFLDYSTTEGFLGPAIRATLLVDDDVERLLDRLAATAAESVPDPHASARIGELS